MKTERNEKKEKAGTMKEEGKGKDVRPGGMTRREFIGTAVVGFAGSCLLLSCDGDPSVWEQPIDYGPNNGYKTLFNGVYAQ